MKTIEMNEQLITDYLLGRLNDQLKDEELLDVEERLYTDEATHERMEQVEDDLFGRFIRGELLGDDKHRFETYFLSAPQRQEQLAFQRALHQVVGKRVIHAETMAMPTDVTPSFRQASLAERLKNWWQAPSLTPAFGLAMATCGLLLAGGLSWSLWRNARLQDELAQARMASQQQGQLTAEQLKALNAQNEQLTEDNRTLEEKIAGWIGAQEGSTKPIIIAAALGAASVITKGPETPVPPKELQLKPQTDFVKLQFEVPKPEKYQQYQVILRRGTEAAWGPRRYTLKSAGQNKLTVLVPGKAFSAGDYMLIVSGVGADGQLDDGVMFKLAVTRK